jgi:hypothetical protein
VATQEYVDTDGESVTVTSPSFSAGTQSINVEDSSQLVDGGTYVILDGLCNCESFVASLAGSGSPNDVTGTFTNNYVANAVVSITITDPGSDYSGSPPTVTITDVNGNTTASATAVLDPSGSFVAEVVMDDGGMDYDPATVSVTFGTPSGTGDTVTATGSANLSGPILIYLAAIWAWFNPGEFTPVQNDVDEPVVYLARIEANFADGIGVRVALGGVTLVAECSGGGSLVWYAGRLVSTP